MACIPGEAGGGGALKIYRWVCAAAHKKRWIYTPLSSSITNIKLFNSPITKNSDLFLEPLDLDYIMCHQDYLGGLFCITSHRLKYASFTNHQELKQLFTSHQNSIYPPQKKRGLRHRHNPKKGSISHRHEPKGGGGSDRNGHNSDFAHKGVLGSLFINYLYFFLST